MAQINTRQVEAFRAVMLTGGMTTASELLGITQPAVSRLIRDLEASLGISLFERRGNQIAPTPDAVSIMAEVERSFVGLTRIADLAKAIRIHAAGSLRVAAMPALATSVLPRYVGRFLKPRPNVRMSVQGMPSHSVIEAVAAGQADFGYALGPLERPGLLVEGMRSAAVAILPAAHRLARKATIQASDFSGERFVAVASGTLLHSRIDAALADVERLSLVETPLSEIACVLVSENVGVSIVDPFSASEFIGRGLVARPFVPAIEVGILMIRNPTRPIAGLATRFMTHFRVHCENIAESFN